MISNEILQYEVNLEEMTVSGNDYSIIINIKNISEVDILNLRVEALHYYGSLIYNNYGIEEQALWYLYSKRDSTLNEMQEQIKVAYKKRQLDKLSNIQKIMIKINEMISRGPIFPKFGEMLNLGNIGDVPYWANYSLQVETEEDLVELEKKYIWELEDDNPIKEAFYIDKKKLLLYVDKINSKTTNNNLLKSGGIRLKSGADLDFVFKFRSPIIFLDKKTFDFQFKISYQEKDDFIREITIIKQKIFSPCAFSVPLGNIIGAVIGYFIKIWLINTDTTHISVDCKGLMASVLLSFIVGIITMNKDETFSKLVTVRDIKGGIAIGGLVGMFSGEFISKLQMILQ